MQKPEYIAGAVYDVDDTLLDNNPTRQPEENLHNLARLDALRLFAAQQPSAYSQLLNVTAQESLESFTLSPVHTVGGAFFTLLKNRGLLAGEVDPTHPHIRQLIEIKNQIYGELLAQHGAPIAGADDFVRAFSTHNGIDDKNAIASTAVIENINTFLGKFGLSHLFPDYRIFDVERVAHPKPHPEAFDKAFLSLDLPESARPNVAAFEDDPRGMLSARKAGLYVCAITTRYSRAALAACEAQPDVIADSFAEFRQHFGLPQ